MRTITYTKNVYTFPELSEDAKYNAIAKYAEYPFNSDAETCLKEFSDANAWEFDEEGNLI